MGWRGGLVVFCLVLCWIGVGRTKRDEGGVIERRKKRKKKKKEVIRSVCVSSIVL